MHNITHDARSRRRCSLTCTTSHTTPGPDDGAVIRRVVAANEEADGAFDKAALLSAKAAELVTLGSSGPANTHGVDVGHAAGAAGASVPPMPPSRDDAVATAATATPPHAPTTLAPHGAAVTQPHATTLTPPRAPTTSARHGEPASAPHGATASLPPARSSADGRAALMEQEAERCRAIAASKYSAVLSEGLLAETHVWHWNASTRLAALLTRE
jgi:hypothetical protein